MHNIHFYLFCNVLLNVSLYILYEANIVWNDWHVDKVRVYQMLRIIIRTRKCQNAFDVIGM